MTQRVRVASADDLSEGERTFVEVGGVTVGVFNVDGTYYAVQNTCPHQYGPVCEGLVQGTLEATWPGPGDRVKEQFSDRPAIACPWHGWEYDLETGIHLGDEEYSIQTYDVIVEDESVFIELKP